MTTTSASLRARVERYVPALTTARTYQRGWLPNDIVAGLVLTAILVPVGMSYAEVAGLPAIAGLYATIVPLLVYALLGPSPIMVLGPDSSLAAIIAGVVLPLAAGDQAAIVGLAAALAILSGLVCVAAGVLRLGFITDLLSMPIRTGYLHGIALTVIVGQLPKLFGFSVSGENVIQEAQAFIQGLADGLTNPAALLLGIGSVAAIVAFRRWLPAIPGILVAVVGATLLTGLLDLATTRSVPVVGALPQGLPRFELPGIEMRDLPTLLAGAFAIALVSMADTSILSRTFAARRHIHVDQDQELLALGAANVATGLFQGFSVSSSTSRTPVAEASGGRTQLTGVVGALMVAAMLVFLPGLTANLPSTTLAAIVIVACLGIVDIPALMRMWQLRREELALSLLCFLAVAVLGVVPGIVIAVGVALAEFVWRAWRPHSAELGRVDGIKGYHDISRYQHARRIPGLVLLRWDAPLFFANAEVFRERVLELIRESPTPTRWVVVAAEPVTDVDLTAAGVLEDLLTELRVLDVDLAMAELKDPVADRLKRYGLYSRIGAQRFFPTIGSAVNGYVEATGTPWVDWEEAPQGT